MKRANRSVDDPRSAGGSACARRESQAKPGQFSLVPMLLFNRDISAEMRRALVESRLQDAAQMVMREHGLDCIEAGDLLGVVAC